jgi:16S rRNA (adenine1518-N6/adenine1519-N6)-dimethyltransferase
LASLIIQGLADVSIVRGLPPSVFWPRPKVDSAIVVIRPNAVLKADAGDVAWFHEIVRGVFPYRREFSRHAIVGIWRDRWIKSDVDQWLETQGLSRQLRAEAINAEEFRINVLDFDLHAPASSIRPSDTTLSLPAAPIPSPID